MSRLNVTSPAAEPVPSPTGRASTGPVVRIPRNQAPSPVAAAAATATVPPAHGPRLRPPPAAPGGPAEPEPPRARVDAGPDPDGIPELALPRWLFRLMLAALRWNRARGCPGMPGRLKEDREAAASPPSRTNAGPPWT